MSRIATLAGLIRSVAIYLCRPDRTHAQARFYARLLSPGDIAFDIGAHLGNRSRAMRRAGASVVALEPQELLYWVLKATLPGDITLVRAAAGAKEGNALLHISRRHPTVSTLSEGFKTEAADVPGFEDVVWSQHQETAVTTLDALIEAHGQPAYIKIDVEGHEAEVLAGLSTPVSLISVEVIPGLESRARAAFDRMEQVGSYMFNIARGEDGVFLFDDWVDRGTLDRWLEGLAPGEKPCDVYARHQET